MAGDRVSTGISNLDKLLNGGFKQESVNLVGGGSGSGKSVFAMQFLVEGLKRGEPCIYICFDEKKKKILEDFSEFGWGLENYERSGLLKFLENSPEQIRRVVADGGGSLDVIATQMRVKRIVIDSISSFSLLFSSEISKREAGLALIELMSRWECTSLLISNAHDYKGLKKDLDFEADSVILLTQQKIKGVRQRALEVVKMRGTKIPDKTMKMDLTNKGISIDPAKTIA